MSRTRALVVLTALAGAVGCVLVAGLVRTGEPMPAPATLQSVVADDPAVDVLRAWDARRGAAYASGSVAALRDLYVHGSVAGRRDVAVLASYGDRGYVVRGMRMQLLAVRVLDRAVDRCRLRVTDRLAGGVAVRNGVRVPLPRDAASTRVLTLVRSADGRWRVLAVSAGR
jgi:hypothetical protein